MTNCHITNHLKNLSILVTVLQIDVFSSFRNGVSHCIGMTNWQNIKHWTSLIILATLPILWMVLQIYAFTSSSNPASLTHLANSKGEVCGEGENEGRENLLYYDISKCAGLEARYENCKSAKVGP